MDITCIIFNKNSNFLRICRLIIFFLLNIQLVYGNRPPIISKIAFDLCNAVALRKIYTKLYTLSTTIIYRHHINLLNIWELREVTWNHHEVRAGHYAKDKLKTLSWKVWSWKVSVQVENHRAKLETFFWDWKVSSKLENIRCSWKVLSVVEE